MDLKTYNLIMAEYQWFEEIFDIWFDWDKYYDL